MTNDIKKETEFIVFGDWRDLRRAIEIYDPDWNSRDEGEKTNLWNFVQGVLEAYHPLYNKCGPLGCGKIVPHQQIYRCADCEGTYCESCIKPHFGPNHKPPQ